MFSLEAVYYFKKLPSWLPGSCCFEAERKKLCSYFRTKQIYVANEQKGKDWRFILGLTQQINHSVRRFEVLKLLRGLEK